MSDKVKVKILVPIGGNADETYDQPEFSYSPETEVELHPKLAKAWIASGIAEEVKEEEAEENGEDEDEEGEPETASVEVSETTSLPRPRGRKKGKK